MTAPSTRPVRKRVGRKGGIAEREPSAAARRPRTGGDDRPRAPIRTRGLTKLYGDLVAVDHLDLEVQAGEIFGLLGQNGAGKTTTILMLLGLTEPTDGQARVVGLDPARRPLEVKRRVGYLPDAVGFYTDMSGRDNLRYTARLNRIERDEAEDLIDEALEQVGLTARADDRTDQYSRGMLQRLGIADALIKDPDVLILDEPTTAIDPLGVTEILDLLRRLVQERQMAILLSSHLLNQVQSVCDRIGIFSAGRLIGQGTMRELASRFGEDTAHVEAEIQPPAEGGPERVREVLTAIPGVVKVTAPRRTSDAWVLDVRPAGDETRVRRAVLAAASATGLDLTSVRSAAPALEDIYRRAVERAAHGHARDVR
ncbi:MAG TPA: ABC transporter ATP-binding protein [Candidatus Limnocylindrales bacterium]|jgi:ABC-2 type transport system ATP-binding protein